MKENIISLRIFSGVHLGAEIHLPEGSYIFGNEDSCDIILHDNSLKARHIQVTIERILSISTTLVSSSTEEIKGNTSPQNKRDSHSIKVKITNMDGAVSLNGKNVESESFIEARTPYYVGQICFAWTEYGDFDYAWNSVNDNMQANAPNLGTKTDNATPADTSSKSDEMPNAELSGDITQKTTENIANAKNIEDSSKKNNKAHNNNANKVGNANTIATQAEKKRENQKPNTSYSTKKWFRYGLYFFITLLFLSLSLTIKETYNRISNNVVLFQERLEDQGFSQLVIHENEAGITLSGILKNDKERAQILNLAQNMHFPVYLDIKIHDDLLNALKTAYNGQGFYPKIDIITGENKIRVNGYLKDKLLLHVIDAYVQKNIPALRSQTLDYNVHYADELQKILSPRINAAKRGAKPDKKPGEKPSENNDQNNDAKFGSINIQYLLGTLNITGDFTKKQKQVLDDIINTLCLELQIPLIVDIGFSEEKEFESTKERVNAIEQLTEQRAEATVQKSTGQNSITNNGTATQKLNSAKPFDVTSVMLVPIKYIILSTGERIFEGGLLPGDYILESITLKKLILNNNGITSTYYLK